MIPLLRTLDIEPAIDLMAANFRKIMVLRPGYVKPYVRVRADILKEKKVWWYGQKSQRKLWDEQGGIILCFQQPEAEPHDALFFTECPRSIDRVERYCRATAIMACVRQPASWERHRLSVEFHSADRMPRVQKKNKEELEAVIDHVQALPFMDQREIDRIRLAHVRFRLSSAHE